MSEITLPEASPRDREIQHVVLGLVQAYAFREAHAILGARLNEMRATELRQIERVFLDWQDLDPTTRPEFLAYAHHRRNPELGRKGDE